MNLQRGCTRNSLCQSYLISSEEVDVENDVEFSENLNVLEEEL